MHSTTTSWKTGLGLVAVILVASISISVAGPLEPPPGPVTSTGRFGPRIDVNTLPGDATAARVISAPGSYYLSGEVISLAGTDGIRVDAAEVTLDLNGYPVRGVAGSLNGIRVSGKNVSIYNGTIINFGEVGVLQTGAGGFSLRDVRVSGNQSWGVQLVPNASTSSSLVHVQAVDNGSGFPGTGGILAGGDSLVSECTVSFNMNVGIQGGIRTSILNNNVNDNFGTAIDCTAPGGECLIANNNASSGGIDAPGSTIINNRP